MQVSDEIPLPAAICSCGWVSHEKRFDLNYHADTHNCFAAKIALGRKDARKEKRQNYR